MLDAKSYELENICAPAILIQTQYTTLTTLFRVCGTKSRNMHYFAKSPN